MDTRFMITQLCNEKGVTIVYIAFAIVLFCAVIGLSADIGYMYVTKGQLQNASDAAALAGAAKLPNEPDARNEAVAFAAANKAAGDDIQISSDSSNTISSSNDVTVGHWNPAAASYTPGGTPMNAVQVRARRTSGDDPGGASIGGRVQLFFSNVIGRPEMGASATAIATRGPRAGYYFMIGNGLCSGATAPTVLSLNPTVKLSPAPGSDNMAWSSLLEVSTNVSDLLDNFLCPADKVPNTEVCGPGISVYTSGGVAAPLFKSVELDFYDPNYDAGNKTFRPDGAVSTWTVIVPVSYSSNPSTQPIQESAGYAKIRIIKACGTGSPTPCGAGRGPVQIPSDVICSGNQIEIDQISCVTCADSSSMLGAKAGLAR